MFRFFMTLAVLTGLSLIGIAPACAEDQPKKTAAAKIPRYKLRIGQQLNYEGDSDFQYDNGKLLYKNTWQVVVVRGNTGGGWRLLVRCGSAFAQQHKSEESDKAATEPTFRDEDVTLAWCDITRDGQIADNPTLGFRADVRAILAQLPDSAEQKSWQSENQLTGQRNEYSLAETPAEDATHLAIEDRSTSPTDTIYDSTHRAVFAFDTTRGLVDHVTTESTQGYGFNGRGSGGIKLVNVEQHHPDWCAAVAIEMGDYFAVKQEYDELIERAGKDVSQAKELLARAKENAEDLRKVVTTKVIQDQLDKLIAGHEQMAQYALEEAERFVGVVGKPSPAWETTDLDGSARSIEGCRGKVVVLDFWYRGCGWCIRAMPQMKQIATHFRGKPVDVFGMNTDRDEKDARFVIEKMALDYPTLKAEGLPEKYGINGFPTLVILDQAGVVRDVHVGYSPTLAKSVMASVDRLLAAPPVAK